MELSGVRKGDTINNNLRNSKFPNEFLNDIISNDLLNHIVPNDLVDSWSSYIHWGYSRRQALSRQIRTLSPVLLLSPAQCLPVSVLVTVQTAARGPFAR